MVFINTTFDFVSRAKNLTIEQLNGKALTCNCTSPELSTREVNIARQYDIVVVLVAEHAAVFVKKLYWWPWLDMGIPFLIKRPEFCRSKVLSGGNRFSLSLYYN